MSDLLAPILVVMENEVDAFWCFSAFIHMMVGPSSCLSMCLCVSVCVRYVCVCVCVCVWIHVSTCNHVYRVIETKASGAPSALHSAGASRPGHRTSHVIHNGKLFTFTEANEPLAMVGI